MPPTNEPSSFSSTSNRRHFLTRSGMAALGAVGISTLGERLKAQAPDGLGDADILNFALNLEYLEAEFYLRAAFGRGLEEVDGQGDAGEVVGGRKVRFRTRAFRSYAEEIAADEEAHVKFLRTALGPGAVARPAIDLEASFTTAARAAGLIGPHQHFDAFADETSFLLAAFIFEDVGVTAYKGAARLLENKDYLEAAAGLLAVEAYHAGEIRTILSSLELFGPARKISDLRDAVDGDDDLDQSIGTRKEPNIVPTDANGLAFSRSAQQVLNIVYLGGASGSYGFFPQGLNGTIR